MSSTRVRLDVWCVNGHLIATYYDRIEEKYPFWCDTCEAEFGDGDCREGKWPWKLTSAVDAAPSPTGQTRPSLTPPVS